MAKIIIRNVGPIKEAEFDLNKVNVFMGPQSSGKSTIAKIISYCKWVEKDVATSQSLKIYQDNKTHFKEHIENFHKIKGYFTPNSYLLYRSDIVEIKWENQLTEINWVDQYAYKRNKISYIPSDRNMITLPEVEKVEFGNTNIRSFLFDWLDARKNYPVENKLSILNLGIDYYYVDNGIIKEDHIRGKNNEIVYDILLSNASSGLQSITPLVAMIDYLAYWIYNEDKTSFNLQENERKVDRYLVDEKVIKPYFNMSSFTPKERHEMVTQLNEKFKENDGVVLKLYNTYKKLSNNLFKTDNTQFIIEEPEQNLFPETQRDLIYHLLEKCLNREGNRLTITTHSPYILYALNNCMMGGLVNTQLKDESKEDFLSNGFLSKKSWIDPQLVTIWEIENGKIRNIQDKDNIISENYFDKKLTDLTDEYYQLLNYYQDEE